MSERRRGDEKREEKKITHKRLEKILLPSRVRSVCALQAAANDDEKKERNPRQKDLNYEAAFFC
jgi:hypothetical protein